MARRYTLAPPAGTSCRVSYEKELNPEQLQVVTAGDGPLLVLAGPGSGKTRTLTYRVAYLLEKGIPPANILLVTFTVKAAREMLDRVERIMRHRPEGLWGGTFHHIGNLILRQHAAAIGRTPAFGILDEEDSKDLLESCLGELGSSSEKRLPQAGVMGTILSLSANTCRPIREIAQRAYPQFAECLSFIERAAKEYERRKQKSNLLDYDDLLTQWLALLTSRPEILQHYSAQFRYILVDEYQDTNRLQFELVRQLGSIHGNVLVVGDDAQSIYAFRGAEVKNLLQFPDIFPNAAMYRLETNYRSTPQILSLANNSIRMNHNQFPKVLKAVREEPGPLPAIVPLMTVRQQAAFVAQRILELREEGAPLQEMAVLFRARFQSAELELELARRNIPYLVRGGVRFFEQAHIKDLLAYVRVKVNPHDEISWQRILRLQEGIGPAYARRIWNFFAQAADPLREALRSGTGKNLSSRAQSSWKKLQKTLREISGAGTKRPSEILLKVLPGYEDHLVSHFEDVRDRREDLEQLVNLADSYESAERFIADITLREPFKGETLRAWEEPDELLVLSTIHQAKGLEWKVVFLVGLVEGQFPHPKSLEDPEALEEERRLFYVAVTRTKEELYLTYPLTRYSYQRGEVILRPSLFIQELPEDLCEVWRIEQEPADPADG